MRRIQEPRAEKRAPLRERDQRTLQPAGARPGSHLRLDLEETFSRGTCAYMALRTRSLSDRRDAALDRIDLGILEALQDNARITFQALSERVGLSARPCLERVRRLERRGVI